MEKRRVVVTGIGIVSPFGCGVDKFWNSLIEGKSGIKTITRIIQLQKIDLDMMFYFIQI